MEYGYVYPAVQKAIQASGRAIRTEKDKALLFIWTKGSCGQIQASLCRPGIHNQQGAME